MTDLRTAARQALTILEAWRHKGMWGDWDGVTDALKAALTEDAMQKFTDVNQELEAALAEPVLQTCNCRWDGEVQVQQCTLHEAHVDAIHEWAERAKTAEKKLAALAEPVQEPGDFDHGIGADRFKVVRGAFWWHVLIGDSPTKHGKFHSRASAEKMAADLLREFRNGAFVQHEAALAEPVAWMHTDPDNTFVCFLEWSENEPGYRGDWVKTPLYAALPQRKED